MVSNSGIAWSPDSSLLAYQSTRRDGRANDLWITRWQLLGAGIQLADRGQ
ncbi:hypothetical protein [Microbulbifer agarilyticus]